MTTLNGLPAHILLVHAIVVLLPLAALLLVLCAVWASARRKLAGPNAILAVLVLVLVPITTDAGEWLERRVPSTDLVRAHTELGDTALYVALPIAVLAIVVWWRAREATQARRSAAQVADPCRPDDAVSAVSVQTETRTVPRRTFLAPTSRAVSVVIAVLSILAAGAAAYDIYRIGDSGAQATWQGQFSNTPAPKAPSAGN